MIVPLNLLAFSVKTPGSFSSLGSASDQLTWHSPLGSDFGETQMRCFFVGIAAVIFAIPVMAATFFGKIESVDKDARTITVESSKKGASAKTFTIPEKAGITVAGKKGDLDSLEEGADVAVYTNSSDEVTRINVRTSNTAAKSSSKSASGKSTTKSVGKSSRNTKSTAATADSADWPCFDGSSRNNISNATGLLKTWPADGPNLAWRTKGLGQGYSSVAVADGLVYTMGNVGPNETITAIELATGKILWQESSGRASDNDQGDGPRGTPAVDGDRVYGLGGHGDLACMDSKTGKLIWKKNILEEFRGSNITWRISESVLIDDNKLICTPGGQDGSVVALNKQTGAVIWRAMAPGGSSAGYSSAIVAEMGNVRQYIQFLHKGILSVRADTGEFLWGDTHAANGTANCSSPLFGDNMVFYSSGYGTGGAMLKLTSSGKRTAASLGYQTKRMESHHGGMVLIDGYIYGASDPGVLRCLELRTGYVKWENRSVGKGSITAADGQLYLRSEQGPVALVEVNSSSYVENGRFEQPDRSGRPAWAHPVVAQGKLFLRDQEELLAYDVQQ